MDLIIGIEIERKIEKRKVLRRVGYERKDNTVEEGKGGLVGKGRKGWGRFTIVWQV